MNNLITRLERAKGILGVVSALHTEAHINQIDVDHVVWALSAVISELEFAIEAIENREAAE